MYKSAFKRHLSYFDLDKDGVITFAETLRAWLGLGLNLPFAFACAIGLQLIYSNAGFLDRRIHIRYVRNERTQFEHVPDTKTSYTLAELLRMAPNLNWIDRLHILQFWNLASNRNGRVSSKDLRLFQNGELLPEIARRRTSRDEALPLIRGGPVIISLHSLFMKRLFDVDVYQQTRNTE